MKDLTGQRFGRLVAVKALPPAPGRRNKRWECRCDCGNTSVVDGSNLTTGNTISCGCARFGRSRTKDITGNRFGRLTAMMPTGRKNGTNVFWLCQCDCGKQTEASSDNLRSGSVTSCGCYTKELAERNLKKGQESFIENELKDQTALCSLTAKTPSNNTSGRKGVYFDGKRGKWVAQIVFQRKCYNLGRYNKFEDAVKAREKAEEKLFEPVLNKYGRTLYDNA